MVLNSGDDSSGGSVHPKNATNYLYKSLPPLDDVRAENAGDALFDGEIGSGLCGPCRLMRILKSNKIQLTVHSHCLACPNKKSNSNPLSSSSGGLAGARSKWDGTGTNISLMGFNAVPALSQGFSSGSVVLEPVCFK